MEYQAMAVNLPKDQFLRAYLEAAEWAGLDEDGREALELAVAPKWSAESIQRARDECDDFQQAYEGFLSVFYAHGHDPAQAGHDFYLSRNGHGAGFFDRGTHSVYALLQRAAKLWGPVSVEFDAETETLTTC